MARETNAAVTFNDAVFMVANEGFTQLDPNMPNNSECMTRAEIEASINANEERFSNYAMNRLVPYHLLEPKVELLWRGINPYCVEEPTPITLEIVSTDVTEAGGSDGTATVQVTSGVGPFDYSWSNGSTTTNSSSSSNTISNLVEGTYSVTVTTSEGVSATISVEVDAPLEINVDTKIYIYFDNSGSMSSTFTPLQSMKSNLLKNRLLPLYNDDGNAYDANVQVISRGDERTIDMLNIAGATPTGNVISLVFQDEADAYFTDFCDFTSVNSDYFNDINDFRVRLENFASNYYRGVVFQVENDTTYPGCSQTLGENFKGFLDGVRYGSPSPYDTYNLANKTEIAYKYGVTDGGTESYYLDLIVNALKELGYNL